MKSPVMSTEIDLSPVEKAGIETTQLLNTYDGGPIVSDDGYRLAGDFLKEIKARLLKMETLRKSLTSPLDQAKKAIMDLFRPIMGNLETAEQGIKRSIMQYQQEIERKAREQQELLRKKALQEAERLKKRALVAQDKGNEVKAQELAQKAAETAAITPTVEANIPQMAGISTKKIWKFEVVDEGVIPRDYLTPDLVKIGRMVRASAGTLAIPGVRIFAETSIGAGSI